MTNEELEKDIIQSKFYEKYMAWKKKNPDVFEKFRELCLQMASRGRFFGIRLVSNKIRWDYAFEYDEEFKISNNYTALITRELMIDHPELKQYLTIKKISKKSWQNELFI